ncbi:MAG: diacylglycerol kinase [Microlunatus sp.]|nr:diacylglycerol kinase [Microlunatus sp.]MDN5771913.1 diacylglycerol kinase [Microlunatus sp.]MDN5804358.1 diacylglycerol kinase [Microlunatus sp.]
MDHALFVLTNAQAGSEDREQLHRAEAVLRTGAEVEVKATSGPDELDSALDQADGRTVVVAGGDGSLHLIASRLYERGELAGTVLGLIPLGTGNDFARGTGVPLDVEAAARVLLARNVEDLDLIVDDLGHITVNNVHLGIGADASRYGARWKDRLGRVGYPIGLLQAAFADPYRLRVVVDDEIVVDREQPLLEVSLGNGATVGGGLALNPGAEPDNGRIDVLVAKATGLPRRLSYGVDLFRGRHPQRRDVVRRPGHHIQVSGDPVYLSADGEIAGPVTAREWRLLRNAVRVILP